MNDAVTTYALLIYRTSEADMPPSALEAALERHRALQSETRSRGTLRAVARLEAAGDARSVVIKGGGHEITDGPYIDTKEWLAGFYLVDCDSEEEARRLAGMIAVEGDHVVEVRPVAWALAERVREQPGV